MVKIRLMRVGKKKQPSYRVVVADSRSPRDGRIIEAIGYYHPRNEPSGIAIDPARAVHWLERGAQPSNQVRKLLEISGAWAVFRGDKPLAEVMQASAGEEAPTPAPKRKKVTAAASVDEEIPEPARTEEGRAEAPADAAGAAGGAAGAEDEKPDVG